MASVFQSLGSTVGWRNHEILSDFEESPLPDRFRKKPSRNLSAVRMSLRKRMPLKEVEMNFDENPTWESLEAKEKGRNVQALTRTARNAFGTVSQKIQKSCQGPTRSLASSWAKASMGSRKGSAKTQSLLPQTPCRKSNRLATISTPTSGTRILSPPGKRSSFRQGSCRLQKDLLPLRRSMRAAALRSPYASSAPARQRRQLDCNVELVSTGIRHLKRLSRAFNDIIVQEERDQAIMNYYQVMAQNLRAAQLRSRNLSQSTLKRQAARLRRALSSWADNNLK
ncbi:protein PIMREG [Rhineura floridana]|uniref:protein PIMREG n=1 Tax=Rhineura floridana TaxID=261503 RepID=UPI002AC7F7D1|nr:protein PIMREG [Rhineura floridana]XP_061460899.1 protein PIMREG [Rhineura floridana]XP_061460900.1 protein PIMREG [Rhineura floridana]XP_061460901.1 protein PIMREG [Rhineura floridana]